MLIEQMILTVVVHHPIGVIIPPAPRRKMELLAILLLVEGLRRPNRIVLVNLIEKLRFAGGGVKLQRRLLALELADIQEHPVIRLTLGQFNLKLPHDITLDQNIHRPLCRPVLDRHVQILLHKNHLYAFRDIIACRA
jgi:hypothetical protein